MKFTTDIVKVYLSDERQAYVEFKAPSQQFCVLLVDADGNDAKATGLIMKHINDKLVSISGVELDGAEAKAADYLSWPSELVNLVNTAYYGAMAGKDCVSKEEEAEKK